MKNEIIKRRVYVVILMVICIASAIMLASDVGEHFKLVYLIILFTTSSLLSGVVISKREFGGGKK